MYKSIEIENLRAITKLEVDNLDKVNLFVGKNNCGKTSLLEAVFFLIGGTNPHLPVNVNTFRGVSEFRKQWWPTYFHDMDTGKPIQISGQTINGQEEKQRLVIRPKLRNHVPVKNSGSDLVDLEIGAGDSASMSEVDGLELNFSDSQGPVKSTIAITRTGFETKVAEERPAKGVFVSPLAMYLVKDRFAAVQNKKKVTEAVKALQEIEPNISDLRLNDIGVLEADIGLPYLIPVNLMGGGMTKLLAISLAMLDSQDGIVLIDEIENGLHKSVLEATWKAIFKWSEMFNVQVFASAHSYECVQAFNNAVEPTLFGDSIKLFRIERKNDKFRAVEYTREELSISLESDWEVR